MCSLKETANLLQDRRPSVLTHSRLPGLRYRGALGDVRSTQAGFRSKRNQLINFEIILLPANLSNIQSIQL